MLFSTIAQPQMFLWMTLSGMLAAAWYAVISAVRRLMRAGRLLSLLADSVFSLGLAAILIAFFLLGSYGQFRLYGLIGSACGFALFYFSLMQPLNAALGVLSKHLRSFAAKIAENRLFNIIFK